MFENLVGQDASQYISSDIRKGLFREQFYFPVIMPAESSRLLLKLQGYYRVLQRKNVEAGTVRVHRV